MSDAEAKLKVTIETESRGQGIPQAAAGLKDVAGAAQKAAPALQQAGAGAKEMGQGLGRAVEVGGATTALMQSLGQASQGGAAGFFAIGRSILAFGQIVKGVLLGAGPVGIAVAALGLLAGAALALKDAFKAPRQPIEDLGKALDELNKKRENNIADYLDEISRKAKQARTDLEAVLAAKEAQTDADEAVALAQVRGDESLTTEQRLRAEQEVKKQAAANRRAIAEQRANQDIIDSARAADAAQRVFEEREKAASEAAAKQKELEAVDPALRRKSLSEARAAMSPQEVATLQAEADRHGNRASLLYSASGAITSSSEQRAARMQEAQDEWAKARAIRERLDPSLVADYDPADAQQKSANLAAAQADAAKKAEQLAAAEKALADARDAATAADTARSTLLSVTDIKANAATKIDTMAILGEQKKTADEQAKKTEQARIEALRRTGYGVASNRFASRDKSISEADLVAAFPDREKDIKKLGAAITPKSMGQTLAEKNAAAQPTAPAPLSSNAIMQRGGGFLPSDLTRTGLPGGITAGPSNGGSENKPGSASKLPAEVGELNKTMQQAGEQAEKKVDLKPAVEGAKKIQEGQEQLQAAIGEMTSAQSQAFSAAFAATQETVATLGSHKGSISDLYSKYYQLRSQIAAQRSQRGNA